MTAVVAAVLAAGAGTRFDGPSHKLLSVLQGRPVVAWAVAAAVEADVGPVVVVHGAVDLAAVVGPGVVLRRNERWREGQATSLQVAVAAADELAADVLVVALGDQPFVVPRAWQAVAAAPSAVAVATYGGRRGHPVALRRDVWPLLPVTGDTGARTVMAERPELVVEVACPGDPADVDTVEDLDRWS